MHSHLSAIRPNLLNPYTQTELTRTAAAERAAETRKRLLDASREVQVEQTAQSTVTFRGQSDANSGGQRSQLAVGLNDDGLAESDQVVEAISVWA